jgi:hypothetical protein
MRLAIELRHVFARTRSRAETEFWTSVEDRGAPCAEFGRGPLEAAGVAGGQDDVGALGAGQAGRLEPDADAAADHEDGLPEQVKFALCPSRSSSLWVTLTAVCVVMVDSS